LDNQLIIGILVGIVIFTLLWVLLRNRGTAATPPAKVEDKPAEMPAPKVAAPPVAVPEPAPKAEKKPAPAKPVAKAGKPAARESATAKPAAAKPAAKKPPAAKKAPAKAAPASPPPMTAIGVPGAVGAPDNLLLLKGVGPKLNTLLVSLGITRFDQIGGWSADDAAKVDAHLGAFKGRIERDSWIEQASLLARGAIAEFETKFGKLDSEN
jgi:predicted flap endonuclease-1-like 5' DNA nuclease